jgi:ADP-heptose:LPS heptosyltransferase
MKIIFYNTTHIGDITYSQPLIREFFKQNPNIDISLFVKYN